MPEPDASQAEYLIEGLDFFFVATASLLATELICKLYELMRQILLNTLSDSYMKILIEGIATECIRN